MLSWPAISGRPAALPDWLFIWSITVTGPNRVFHFTISVDIFYYYYYSEKKGQWCVTKASKIQRQWAAHPGKARHLQTTRWFKVNRNRADAPWKQSESTGIKQTHHGKPSEQRQRGWQSSTKALDKPRNRSDSPAHLLARRTVAALFFFSRSDLLPVFH